MCVKQHNIGPDSNGNSGTSAVKCEAQQAFSAFSKPRDLASNLMKDVADKANLKRAFKAVKRNKGAPGIDNISIKEVGNDLDNVIVHLQDQLLAGTYLPCPVKGVKIPKPSGGTRQLGIPTVIDRMVQQAISQVLTTIFDPLFSESSYGFRPKRSAKQAILQASQFVRDDRMWVVDIDLEKFFDKVNHDILMALLAKQIQDKALLRLVRRFLTAGMMQNGICMRTEEGTPQGGPLSPLLSNVMLHELDKELQKRGHTFCRYADDCNIYVRSQAAGQRVLHSLTHFIEKRLKLKVNAAKSAVDKVNNRTFLGFRLRNNGDIAVSPQSLKRIKNKIRYVTKRNRGISLAQVIKELNPIIRGWFHYFKWTNTITLFKQLDAWIRRRLRCFRLKQRKRKYSIKTFLQSMGVNQQDCWALACSDKGWWRKALNPIVHRTLSIQWFKSEGLFSLAENFVKHKSKTAVCDIARTVV